MVVKFKGFDIRIYGLIDDGVRNSESNHAYLEDSSD
jgi:hypothetical protein